MKEMLSDFIKVIVCILGATSLYTGLVSLVEDNVGLFFVALPFNVMFIWWYSSKMRRYNAEKSI